MKNSLLIGILCLGIGFGAAWLVKPGEEPEVADNATAGKSNTKTPRKPSNPGPIDQPTKSDREPENKIVVADDNAGDQPDAATRRQMRQGQDRWMEAMKKRRVAKEEAQIKKLVDRLGLSDAQAEQLRSHFDKSRVDLAAMMEGGNEGDWSKAKDFTKLLRGEGLDAELDNILTDEQKESYTEMKERDRSNKVEARAYKDLAKVQGVLDLSQEQKDEVYDILYDQAETKVDANKDANAMFSMFTEGMGIEIDPEELGISGAIQTQIDRAASGEEVSQDPADFMEIMRENQEQRVNEKVELLAPVLDETQQEAYRAHLESQGGGLLGGLLGGAQIDIPEGGVEIRETIIEIPPRDDPSPTPEPTPPAPDPEPAPADE